MHPEVLNLLGDLKGKGLLITAEAGKVVVKSPDPKVLDEARPLLEELRQRKTEVLEALAGSEPNPEPEPDHQAFIHQARDLFPGSREISRVEWTLEDKFQFCLDRCRRIAGNPTTREGLERVNLRLLAALFTSERIVKEQGGDPLTLEGIRYAQRRLGFGGN